jgi:hypothetical protein
LLTRVASIAKRHLVVILDQFEEYSLYQPDDVAFAESFAAATRRPDLPASFIVSLREEALARLDKFEGSIPSLFDNFRRIEHLDFESGRAAIRKPLAHFKEKEPGAGPDAIEPELVEKILDEVRTGKVGLAEGGQGKVERPAEQRVEAPYLQLVLTRLWTHELNQHSNVLRLSSFESLGKAKRIVQGHLDEVMKRLPLAEQGEAAQIFTHLVTPSGAKIAHTVDDLAEMAKVDRGRVRAIVDALANGPDRILRDVPPLPEQPTVARYEIFHDRLGAAILDWRSRFLREHEASKGQEKELGLRETLQGLLGAALSLLDPKGRKLAARIFRVLSSGKTFAIHQLAAEVGDTPLEVERLLDAIGPAIVRPSMAQGERTYQISHRSLEPLVLDWVEWSSSGSPPPPEPLPSPAARPPSAPPVALIRDLFAKGRVLTVFGAGASASGRPAGSVWTTESPFPPVARELASELAHQVDFPRGGEEDSAPSLPVVASYAAAVGGVRSLQTRVREILSRSYEPTATHRWLAKSSGWGPLLIMTTAVDTMLELAFDEAGRDYDVVFNVCDGDDNDVVWRRGRDGRTERGPSRMVEPRHDVTCIYKLFGSVARPNDRPYDLIMREEDMVGLLAGLFTGTLLPPRLASQISEMTPLFLAIGIGKWFERTFFGRLWRRVGTDTRGFAVARGISALEAMHWRALGVACFDRGVDEFVALLEDDGW